MVKRYTTRAFPPYAHLPGVTPHPKKINGHSQGQADPLSYALSAENWREHEDYLYAVDLHNAGFFWEAHVWWEAVWKATLALEARAFVQGLIKATAGALKKRMQQIPVARDHAKRAHELMAPCFSADQTRAFGVSRFWWDNVVDYPERPLEIE